MMKRNIFFLVLLILLFPLSRGKTAGGDIETGRRNAITRAIEKVSPAVAGINVTQTREYVTHPMFSDPLWNLLFPEQIRKERVKSLGSGVIISPDGYIVTNSHVVEGADEIIVTLSGGAHYRISYLKNDPISDVAILKLDQENLPYAPLGDSDDIILGEWVIALGNPFGLFDVNYSPTATVGIISGVNLDFGKQESGRVYQDMIQTDASINMGNSGGPLVNADGEVIGINTFIFTGGAYNEGSIGIGFALPINRVKKIIEELKASGRVDRTAGLGFRVQTMDRFLALYLGLPSVDGVIVTDVDKGGPADKAGLEIGDVILKINDSRILSANDIEYLMEELKSEPEKELNIDLIRKKGNRFKEIFVKIILP